MARKKKRGRKTVSALSPINKKGIKIGTLLVEAGIAKEAFDRGELWKSNPGEALGRTVTNMFDINKDGGKMVLTGIALALAGRLTGFKSLGPIQLS